MTDRCRSATVAMMLSVPFRESLATVDEPDESKMKQRLNQILRSLIGEERLFTRLDEVSFFGEGTFEMKLSFLPSDMFSAHRTFLHFSEFCDGEKLSLDIEHIWGWLDPQVPVPEMLEQLLYTLKDNTGSWHSSGLFLGMREFDGTNFLTLNCSDRFLTKWPDDDFRELLGQRISDVGSAFMTYNPSLTAFRNNYQED